MIHQIGWIYRSGEALLMKAFKILPFIISIAFSSFGADAISSNDEEIKVTVTGRVVSPGEYRLGVDADLLDAIIIAEGFDLYAATNSVRIKRGDLLMKVDVRKLLKSYHKRDTPKLHEGDVIIVPHGEFVGPSNKEEVLRLFQQMKAFQAAGHSEKP